MYWSNTLHFTALKYPMLLFNSQKQGFSKA